MRSLTAVFLITSTLVIGACAGSPARIAAMSPQDLKRVDSYDLCNAYASSHPKSVRAELEKRGAIPAEDWPLIDQKQLRVGMTELALVCAWGKPRGTSSHINETMTARGLHRQWVYRKCRDCRAQYVYTENGRVTALQR